MIEKAEPVMKVGDPLLVRVVVRTVAPDSERTGGRPAQWRPLISDLSTIDQLAATRMRSTTLTDAVGTAVDQPCDADATDRGGFTELLTQIDPVGEGAWIEGIKLTYSDGNQTRSLTTTWVNIACGSAITDPDRCNQGDQR